MLAAAALLVPPARRAGERFDVSGRVDGSESSAVAEALAGRFEFPFSRKEIAVVTGVPGPSDAEGRAVLRAIVATISRVPGVKQTYSHLDLGDAMFLPRAGKAQGTFVVVGLDPSLPADVVVPRLRAAARSLLGSLRVRHPKAVIRWAGEDSFNRDLRQASSDEVRRAEARALPLTLALLLAAFGAVVASLLPLLVGLLSVTVATGLAVVLTNWMTLTLTVQSIVSMLGLGLGIDYALLMVSRFREAVARGLPPTVAAEEACRHAGGTIVLSGSTVVIGLLGLLVVPDTEMRSVATGGLLVVGVSVLLAVTLLPAVLGALGRRVDALPLPWTAAWRRAAPDRRSPSRLGPWRRWAHFVTRRPVLVLLVAGLPVALLASQALRLRTEIPAGEWLPSAMESTLAIGDLRSMGHGAVAAEYRLLVELPEDVSVLSVEGWRAQGRLEAALRRLPAVADVRSLRTIAGDRADDLAYVSFLPGSVKRSFLSSEGDASLLEVEAHEGATLGDLASLVRDLRRLDVSTAAGLAGVRVRVGGIPAFGVDYEDALASRFWPVVALVCVGTLLALFVAFRSVLLPLKAVALNALSVGGAVGALVLVFQDGHGRWLGLPGPTGGVFSAVPLLVFAVVFGLSMDYEVFLLARIAEARREGSGEGESIVEGLARSAGIITSAAAVMVVVFGAFAACDMLLVQMLGFTLAVAVFLDASVVRTAVGPALLRLAGRWNWWPGRTTGDPS